MKKKTGTFLISINDGFCEWTYPITLDGDNNCIDKIHKEICRSLKVKVENGTMRRSGLRNFEGVKVSLWSKIKTMVGL